ncbi:MAG TPA: tRNA epoxyqueuosine(34) reductase QueG [Chitinophagaceae bacterium]|nr:tRNA epoxyqueuosine(34) reductase QueG [Chitinophagaceae bacterium]
MGDPFIYSRLIKTEARRLGFDLCGIARAEKLEADAVRLDTWLKNGRQGKMQYMEHYFDLRIDPRKLVEDARSVITLLFNYFPADRQVNEAPKVSKYAFGEDYHEVIKARLKELLFFIQQEIGEVHGRGFVDSAPVLERTWANKSGLGWVGKNGNLINRQTGSFLFIATLIVDLPLGYDDPFAGDYCGNCTRCLDACPTGAILSPREIDGSRCISYFTIELKDAMIPEEFRDHMENWVFGCDICQDVCPWNRFSKVHHEPAFSPIPEILNFTTADWEELSGEAFRMIFGKSPIKRTGFKGMKRNLRFIQPIQKPDAEEHPVNNAKNPGDTQ